MNKIAKYVIESVEIAGKTALSVIPIGGALSTAIYDSVKGNCLSNRQEKWKTTLEERLSTIEATLDDVGNSEMFTTAIIKATELAVRTSSEEKRAYLANAVANSLNAELTEEKLIVFFSLLEKYTISHIKIINFFHMPTRFENVQKDIFMYGTPQKPLFMVYPELDNELFSKIYTDLYLDGIVSTDRQGLNTTMSGQGMVDKRTTNLGDEFLAFIMENSNETCDEI